MTVNSAEKFLSYDSINPAFSPPPRSVLGTPDFMTRRVRTAESGVHFTNTVWFSFAWLLTWEKTPYKQLSSPLNILLTQMTHFLLSALVFSTALTCQEPEILHGFRERKCIITGLNLLLWEQHFQSPERTWEFGMKSPLFHSVHPPAVSSRMLWIRLY